MRVNDHRRFGLGGAGSKPDRPGGEDFGDRVALGLATRKRRGALLQEAHRLDPVFAHTKRFQPRGGPLVTGQNM